MSEFSWVATDLLTGDILADLPGLDVPSVKQTLGRYESATGGLPIPTAPVDWKRATLEGASNLILTLQPTDGFGQPVGQPVPVWGGMVTQSTPNETDVVPLSLATIESYLDRRYVGDRTYVGVGQNDIIADLINSFVKIGPNGGIPIRVQYVTAGAGTPRDRQYKDQDDKTVYSVMTDLMGVDGGPEWTIGWEWQHSPERITPVLYVGDRIGAATPAGMGPAATFEMPGPVSAFQMVRDYSNGKGATSVIATSSGQGTLRPQSPPQTTTDPTRPTFEHRFSPSTSITDMGTLTGYAKSAVAALDQGTISLAMSCVATAGPQLGTDWSLGDDIGFVIGGIVPDLRTYVAGDLFSDVFSDTFGTSGVTLVNSVGRDTVPAFPGGISGTARVLGYELTLGQTPIITPVLVGAQIL